MEQRGCWTERPAAVPAVAPGPGAMTVALGPDHRLRLPPRTFVPVDLLGAGVPTPAAPGADSTEAAPPFLPADTADSWDARTSLFGDAER